MHALSPAQRRRVIARGLLRALAATAVLGPRWSSSGRLRGRGPAYRSSLYRRRLMAEPRGRDDQERASGVGAHSDPPGSGLPRYRRRRSAPSASETYQSERFQLVVSAAIGVIGVAAGIVALVLGEVQGLLLLGGGSLAVFIGIWTPHRVVLDESGVLLHAVVRRIRVPWDELESVEPSWWDVQHVWLRWGRTRGLAVLTLQAFPDLHTMFAEIERRSPRTSLAS